MNPGGPFLYPPRTVLRRYLATVGGHATGSPTRGAVLLVLLAAGSVLVVARFGRRFAEPIVVGWGLTALFIAAALCFSLVYSTEVPGDFGMRRLFDYSALTLALLIAGLLAAAAAWAGRRSAQAATTAAIALSAAVAVGAAGVGASPPAPYAKRSLATMDAIGQVVPCDARLLPNVRTAGSFAALLGRGTVLEGMAPYLRPWMMSQVLPRLIGGRQFFADPRRNAAYLDREGIEYVVVLDRVSVGSTRGVVYDADRAALSELPGLRVVARQANATIYAYAGGSAVRRGGPGRCD
jgi:hypothetical protein